jgi:REP-associated tyrosine transposase
MSRLRRLQLSGRIFFVTCNVLRTRLRFADADYKCLADSLAIVRARRGYLLAGYVFMPDHWHALILPTPTDTIDLIMNGIKTTAARKVNRQRVTRGPLWHSRYFDRIMRTVKELHETLEYMHLNPVRAGLVSEPGLWPWSSYNCFGGSGSRPLEVDNLNLPPEETAFL